MPSVPDIPTSVLNLNLLFFREICTDIASILVCNAGHFYCNKNPSGNTENSQAINIQRILILHFSNYVRMIYAIKI